MRSVTCRTLICMWLFAAGAQSTCIVDSLCDLSDYLASYKETYITYLSTSRAVTVPLLTINGWILMRKKVTGGSVLFQKIWVAYCDSIGSVTGNDNYWLALDKVCHPMELLTSHSRVEVICWFDMPLLEKIFKITSFWQLTCHFAQYYRSFEFYCYLGSVITRSRCQKFAAADCVRCTNYSAVVPDSPLSAAVSKHGACHC